MFNDTDEYSGRLLMLETDDTAVKRPYLWGAFGTIWFRREYEGAPLGRTYDTLVPNYWATASFIWDYSLSSVVHALFEPVQMRRPRVQWIASDNHAMFGARRFARRRPSRCRP